MSEAHEEPAVLPSPARRSWRDALATPLREHRALELLLLLLPFALRALGVIKNASLLLFLVGWLALWLRRAGWRSVGLRRPASWRRTLLLGLGIGVAYDALDILVLLPALRGLTGQAVDLGEFAALRGDTGALLVNVMVVWVLAAFVEELAYRGYAFDRIAELLGRSRGASLASALVVSLLFGYAHVAQGPTGVLDSCLAGLLFAALYLASGRNLWLAIVVHGVVDTTSLVVLYLGYDLA